jgi:ribonuclease BN (tRNA processing enzyme)
LTISANTGIPDVFSPGFFLRKEVMLMSGIDLIFLGTGDAFNTDGKAHQSLLIKTAALQFLVDAGPTCLYQMAALSLLPEELDYIFITHFHGDHTAGLPFLFLYLEKKRKASRLPVIIGPRGIKKRCRALCQAAYRDTNLGKNFDFQEFSPRYTKGICFGNESSFDIYPVTHKPESIGYRFYLNNKVIAFTGDAAMDDKVLRLINNSDAAIIECNLEKPVQLSHTSLEEFVNNLPEIKARCIIPVHTTKEILKKIELLGDDRICMAADGKTITI